MKEKGERGRSAEGARNRGEKGGAADSYRDSAKGTRSVEREGYRRETKGDKGTAHSYREAGEKGGTRSVERGDKGTGHSYRDAGETGKPHGGLDKSANEAAYRKGVENARKQAEKGESTELDALLERLDQAIAAEHIAMDRLLERLRTPQ